MRSLLFDAIPVQLGKKASRYQVSSVLANRQASDILEKIAELTASKSVLAAYHASDPHVGMSSSIDLEKFKLYIADAVIFQPLAKRPSTHCFWTVGACLAAFLSRPSAERARAGVRPMPVDDYSHLRLLPFENKPNYTCNRIVQG